MDQGEVTSAVQHPAQDIFFLSWVAYIRPLVLFLVMGTIGLIVSQSARDANFILVGYAILFIAIIKVIYDIAWRRRFMFYYDEDGVWVFRGILPWKKGIGGVKWRDIDEATYYTGFISWLTKSYRVRVGHRFTHSSEILVAHIKRGNLAVAVINQKLMQDFPR
ncbi:hypothetical protein [Acerihabitans arboris]|uniref:Uncharacterized protein n=1 Tax=Acerihabitans arboris TaxID=2691583 RepID=A0A845SHE8_9GAMM|nr:hypothetical protein [Acerihabitans arboris]NDL62364.1 hypothetical protein [Acerihabitans arboris]